MNPDHRTPPPGKPAPMALRATQRRRLSGLAALVAGAGLLALAACGQKGPLYMPDPNDPTKKRS